MTGAKLLCFVILSLSKHNKHFAEHVGCCVCDVTVRNDHRSFAVL